MHIRKAVITAAAPNQNRLPLQQLVDRNGDDKTALQLIIEETVAAGVEQICVVIRGGDEEAYRAAAGSQAGSLHFVQQSEPRGYADAIFRTRSFVAGEPFLHLVGDHLYLSNNETACAKQLVDIASEFECAVSAVQPTRENSLPFFGVVSGPLVPQRTGLYEIQSVIEKPTPTLAEQQLVTPGLRAGHYLGFFGMHVLTPEVMELVESQLAQVEGMQPTLSDAVAQLPSRGKYLAFRVAGTRYNLGMKYGLLKAQLAIGLSGDDRDEILTELIDLMASRAQALPGNGAAT